MAVSIKTAVQPVSLFQLFSIGIGPSSSHTVGPMRAARLFCLQLQERGILEDTASVTVELFGSLAMTGKGHATDLALLLGLEGHTPEGVDPQRVPELVERIDRGGFIRLLGTCRIPFRRDRHLVFHFGKRLPFHSNALRFTARDAYQRVLLNQLYYSVGGGFIVPHEQVDADASEQPSSLVSAPFPFRTYGELSQHCQEQGMQIWEIVLENEKVHRSEDEIREGILNIWHVMEACVQRGCTSEEEILPGGLNLKRRAPALYKKLLQNGSDLITDPADIYDWVSLFALAVNEENAAGGRVVTAPTNGASGLIPAVLHYYQRFASNPTEEGIVRFFLTATAMGILYKEGASLSAAEMGCQGEVGVAASMAAGGLVAALGGTNDQVEHAAEMGMEHHLGLTCDPVMGLVQVPCISRNASGANQAIQVARLALREEKTAMASLDQVIEAMRLTGNDLMAKYKETSEGGLAIVIAPTCC